MRKQKIVIACILIALCVGGALLVVDPPSMARLTVWENMLYYIKQHPWTGSSIGNFRHTFRFLIPVNEEHKQFIVYHQGHNEYLQVLYEMGIVGLIPAIMYLITTFWAGIKKPQALIPLTAMVIIAVNSVYNFPFHVATTALVAVTWMAIFNVKMRVR